MAEFLFFFIFISSRRIRYFIERSSISVMLAFKKSDRRNEIRHRRWRYFIVPGDRFRCEIPTRDALSPAPSRRRTSCKLKASSMPGATFCKIFAALALSTFLKLALRKQRLGLIIDAARVTWLPPLATRKSSRVNFLKRSSCRSPSVLKPVREEEERLENGVHIISEARYLPAVGRTADEREF